MWKSLSLHDSNRSKLLTLENKYLFIVNKEAKNSNNGGTALPLINLILFFLTKGVVEYWSNDCTCEIWAYNCFDFLLSQKINSYICHARVFPNSCRWLSCWLKPSQWFSRGRIIGTCLQAVWAPISATRSRRRARVRGTRPRVAPWVHEATARKGHRKWRASASSIQSLSSLFKTRLNLISPYELIILATVELVLIVSTVMLARELFVSGQKLGLYQWMKPGFPGGNCPAWPSLHY